MATEKLDLKEIQRRKAEAFNQVMRSFNKAFSEGTVRQISEPKPA